LEYLLIAFFYLGEIGKLENYQNDVALVGLTTKLDRRATLKQTE
jgi:hypothetical protein